MAAVGVLGLTAVFAVTVRALISTGRVGLAIDDLGQLLAAGTASAACLDRARRCAQSRRAWLLLALGTGSWTAGQAVWTWYEVVVGVVVPFPGLADIGFLAFPLLTSAGLLLWLSGEHLVGRTRDVLDGAVIAGSLLVVSWATTLGQVAADGEASTAALWLALAYPVSDVLMLTVVVLALAHTRDVAPAPLVALAAGLGGLAVADSAYVYLVGRGLDISLASPAWFAGFLLIAVAARADGGGLSRPDTDPVPSWSRLSLPYVPLALALVVIAVQLGAHGSVPAVEQALGLVLVAAVVGRQALVLSDNRTLVVALRQREAELAHQAFHDPLTGLANRALFLDRLTQRIVRNARDGSGLVVLFCDLDDFKHVNDQVGHAAGDALLVAVADRLRGALRSADTVARLGGDEFAALLEPPFDEVAEVAERLVDAVGRPLLVHGVEVPIEVSVGVAVVEQGATSPSASALLAEADRAMYAAKASGGGRAVLSTVLPPLAPVPDG